MKRGEQTTNFGQRVELIMHLYMDCNSFLVIVSCITMQQYLVVQTSEALNYNRINNESIYNFNFQNIFGSNTVGNSDIIIGNSMIPILLWVLLPALLPILWTIFLQLPLLRADTASVHFNSRVPLLPVTSTHILDMTLGFVSPTLLANCKSHLFIPNLLQERQNMLLVRCYLFHSYPSLKIRHNLQQYCQESSYVCLYFQNEKQFCF